MNLKVTPLNAAHRRLSARLVDFGGWEMPLHYGSQIAEHQNVRRDAGMFDVSHMLAIDIAGEGARDFLLKLLANNVDRLKKPGKALYSCMLNQEGGVIDDLIVYFLDQRRYRVVVNAATAEKDLAWTHEQSLTITKPLTIGPRRDLAMIAVQGPAAREKVWRTLPEAKAATEPLEPFSAAEVADLFIARTGYTGEDGFELMLPAGRSGKVWDGLLGTGVAPAGLGARDTLRLEAGMNLYGEDMDETVTPFECGLEWTVDLQGPRDFIGKQALTIRPRRTRMLGLILVERGVLRAHQPIETSGGPGLITSGSFSPTLQAFIALARVPLSVLPNQPVKVSVRDKWLAARTVKFPCVRRGRSLLADFPAVVEPR